MAKCVDCDERIGPKSRVGICDMCYCEAVEAAYDEGALAAKDLAFVALIDELRTQWLPNHSRGDYA